MFELMNLLLTLNKLHVHWNTGSKNLLFNGGELGLWRVVRLQNELTTHLWSNSWNDHFGLLHSMLCWVWCV